jgi:hypothetical protein
MLPHLLLGFYGFAASKETQKVAKEIMDKNYTRRGR